MSSPSSSSSQPPSAQLGASRSRSRLPSAPPSQGEDSSRPSPQENAENDRDDAFRSDAELERAPRRPRPRVLEYVPRRRATGDFHELVEGEDYNLADLWGPDIVDRDHVPPPEVVYESFDDALTGVHAWAQEHGVAYRKQKYTDARHHKLLMVCSRTGKPRAMDESRPRPGATSQRTDCKMKFYLQAVDNTQVNGQWRVKWCLNRASIIHNHAPEPDAFSFAKYRRATRTDEMRSCIKSIWPRARGPKQAMLLLEREFPEAVFERQDLTNEYRALDRHDMSTRSKVEVLFAEMEAEEYWYRYQTDSDNAITHLVFISPQCLSQLKASPDVLLLDCTYKTNKYKFPLLTLVGLNGHNRTIHLGVALMRQTDEASFTWVLTHLKALFDSHGIQIQLWLTDNDAALVNALDAVFARPRINMCRWHMNKDVLSYLRTQLSAQFGRRRVGREYQDNDSTTNFMNLYTALMDSPTVADYETRLADCERMSHEATAYLKRYWLNRHKEKLVSCWVDAHPNFGLTTTSAVEGAHRILKEWLGGSQADILWLFRRLHPLYKEHNLQMKGSNRKDNARTPNYCQLPIYQGILFRITRYALHETSKRLKYARAELEKQRLDSSYQFSPCKGRYTRSTGIPCWHRVAELWRTSGFLQASDYHVHWWINRNQIDEAEAAERPTVPLEPRPIQTQQRQQHPRHGKH